MLRKEKIPLDLSIVASSQNKTQNNAAVEYFAPNITVVPVRLWVIGPSKNSESGVGRLHHPGPTSAHHSSILFQVKVGPLTSKTIVEIK